MKSISALLTCVVLAVTVGCKNAPILPPPLDGGRRADGTSLCNPANCTGCCLGDACLSGTARSACGWGGLSCVICQGNEKCQNKQCVPYTGKCDQFSCPIGCCKGKTCKPGTSNKECGKGGKQCVACAPDKTCVGGACGLSGACTGANCKGCCSGSKCHPGTGDQFCGKGGQGCKACNNLQKCMAGVCKAYDQCSTKNCAGCCSGAKCQPGNLFHLCGKGGQQCKACQTGQACNQGVCDIPPAQCTPANCSGCCDGNKCQPGTTFTHCGYGGSKCKQCPGGQQCNKGTCGTPPPTCTPANCSGCCSGGTCNPGTTFGFCGKNGQQCKACQSGEQCQNGACVVPTPTCGPGNCTGCCQGTTCKTGSSTSACGLAGASCKACAKYELCSSGSCSLDMYSKWSITLSYANLLTSKSWDMGGKPDPYVLVTLGSQTKTTTIKKDTYYPTWNEYVFTATANAILTMKMKALVKDSDVTWDQDIGTCYVSVSKSNLLSGYKTSYSCDVNGYISTLKFKYTAN